MGRLAGQNLFHQVIDDVTMTSGKGLDKTLDIRLALHGEGGQLQAGNPTLSPGFKRNNILRRKVEAHDLVEKGGDLRRRKTEITGSQLDQLSPDPQPGQG